MKILDQTPIHVYKTGQEIQYDYQLCQEIDHDSQIRTQVLKYNSMCLDVTTICMMVLSESIEYSNTCIKFAKIGRGGRRL